MRGVLVDSVSLTFFFCLELNVFKYFLVRYYMLHHIYVILKPWVSSNECEEIFARHARHCIEIHFPILSKDVEYLSKVQYVVLHPNFIVRGQRLDVASSFPPNSMIFYELFIIVVQS